MEHPVGTGPYRLAQWRRSSLIAFEKNPNYREVRYDEEAPADDPLAQAA
jgi:ABC-type transport system substrate-binding protein